MLKFSNKNPSAYLHRYQYDLYTASPWKHHKLLPSIQGDICSYIPADHVYIRRCYCSHLDSHLKFISNINYTVIKICSYLKYEPFTGFFYPLTGRNDIKWKQNMQFHNFLAKFHYYTGLFLVKLPYLIFVQHQFFISSVLKCFFFLNSMKTL